jgi:purine-binding chemotaxis protein CheW
MEQVTKTEEKVRKKDEEKEPYIIFDVAGTTYAIHSRHVQQMEMIENITPVPNTPAYVDGVMFSRGQVVPLINLRLKFGLQKAAYDMKTRVIIINHEDRIVGLIADSAKEYLNISASAVQETPDLISGANASWLKGIARLGERTILIFNVNELMKSGGIIKTT